MLPDLEIIKILRKKSGLTQKELSKLMGVSQSYINKIENLSAEPPYNIAKKIIELLQRQKAIFDGVVPEKIMTKIRAIEYKRNLIDALNLMDELNVSQLPVCNKEVIVGSITKKTMAKLIKQNNSNILNESIEKIMDFPFPMIPKDSPMELISLLLGYSEAVLILNHGKFCGIITRHDLIKTIK